MFGFTRKPEQRLWEAVLVDAVDQVRELLQADPPLARAQALPRLCRREAGLVEEATPLHLAAARSYAQVVKLLLVAGADVNARAAGATPLHEAAREGHVDVAELLLFREADVEAVDGEGRTALHRAAMAGHDGLVNLLLDHHANIEAVDHEGHTVLHWLAAGGCEAGIKRVLEAGAETDPCNEVKRRTPLHLAVVHADHRAVSRVDPDQRNRRVKMERVVRVLIEHGADVNAVDAGGNTPLDLFNYLEGDNESDSIVRLLRKHGGRWMRYHHRHTESSAPARAAPSPGDERPHADLTTFTPDSHGSHMGTASGSSAITRRAMGFVGEPLPLDAGSVLIGRNPECDIRYRSRTLSRRHAQITYEQGSYMISDLGSHNGVQINGRKVHAPHLLSPGEIITLGAYEFEFDGENLIPLREELDDHELRAELGR